MNTLENLLKMLPDVSPVHTQAEGFCLWIVWQSDKVPVFEQILEDYGGVSLASEGKQNLWFFFSNDAFLASARIAVWAKFNTVNVSIQILPCTINVNTAQQKTVLFEEGFRLLSVDVPLGFRVLVHESLAHAAEIIPGLSLKDIKVYPNLTQGKWGTLSVDPRLPYLTTCTWYVILQPVGSPLDKAFQNGWNDFLRHLEDVLQRNKFRFTIDNYFLMFKLDTLRDFKAWCAEFLSLIEWLKIEHPDHYWPCVQAVADRKGLSLNTDLPHKIGLEWDQLSPDYPYMFMRNALMLGNDFTYHPVGFASTTQSSEDWCSVTLNPDDLFANISLLPNFVSMRLEQGGFGHCFYCGLRSHTAHDCPSRFMQMRDNNVWKDIAQLNFAEMAGALALIDEQLGIDPENFEQLVLENSPVGAMTRAYFEPMWPAQIRSIALFWRVKGKDILKVGIEGLMPEDESSLWQLLYSFPEHELAELDKSLQTLGHRFPSDYRIASLSGFVAMERGDFAKAITFWKEAEIYSAMPVLQAWHIFLRGRLFEIQGQLPQAIAEYEACQKIFPEWLFIQYRTLVCEIKRGFAERVMGKIITLITLDGNFFNKLLHDPEIERGHIQVFATLSRLWIDVLDKIKNERNQLEFMKNDINNWFLPDDPFAQEVVRRADKLLSISTDNYVACQNVLKGRERLTRDFDKHVRLISRDIKADFKGIVDRLHHIYEESVWFPFPRILGDFNENYNKSAATLNWALRSSFQTAENFKKAQVLIGKETERLKKLEGRMRFLRVIRDGTLFVLSLGEAFLWIEAIGLVLIFVLLPLLLVYGDKMGLEFVVTAISKQRWQVQKILFFIVTFCSAGIAGIRTLFHFEKIRSKVLTKAKRKAEQAREKAQATKLAETDARTERIRERKRQAIEKAEEKTSEEESEE